MTGTNTHYDVLGVSETASEEEIKDAFFELVREHPPEQDPDAYQQLREAYDVLSDPIARREYDSMAQHGDEIDSLQEEAEALLNREEPDVQTAIEKLKRATVLGPDIGLLRDRLGTAYLLDNQPEKALAQFDKAIDLNEANQAYHLNRGQALQRLGRLQEAERTFRGVWTNDKGDYAAARGLAGVHAEQERYQQAHEVLDEAIWADDTLDFEDFFCYYDKLQLYVLQNETKDLESALDTVIDMAETPDDQQFASFMLAQASDDLYAVNAFGLSHRFAEAAEELHERSVDQEMLKHIAELRDLKEAVEAIMDSNRYHEAVQQMVAMYYDHATGMMTDQEVEEAGEQVMQGMENLMQADPDHTEVKKSLRRIRSRHPEAFKLNEEFFELILDVPDAELFIDECPYCGEQVLAEKGRSGKMVCPECNRNVYSNGRSYSKPSSSTHGGSTSSSSSSSNTGSSSSNTSSSSANNEDCFVATAVYGDVDHPDVRQLRRFRDETLRHSGWGRAFITWYYRHGPGLANRLEKHRRLKRAVRWALRRAVALWLR